jgi:O-antigen/teichoic acid export membrane protein
MISKKLTGNVIFNLLSFFLNFISTLFVARIGGASVLGNIGLATSFQDIIKNVIQISIINAHLKIYNEDDKVGFKTYAVLLLLSKIILSCIITIFVIINFLINKPIYTSLQINLIIFFIGLEFINFFFELAQGINTAKLNIFRANLPGFLTTVFASILKILVVLWGYKEFGIAVSLLMASLLSLFLPIKYILKEYWGKFHKSLFKKYLLYSANFLTSAISAAFMLSFDKVILGTVVSSAFIGYYSSGNRLGLLFFSVGASVGGIFLSVFSKHSSTQNIIDTIEILKKYEKYIFLIVLPPLLIVSLFGKELLQFLFGNDFGIASTILVFSLLNGLVKTLNIPLINFLYSYNQFKGINIINILYTLVIVIFIVGAIFLDPFNDIITSVSLGLLLSSLFERYMLIRLSKGQSGYIKWVFNLKIFLFFMFLSLISLSIVTYFPMNLISKIFTVSIIAIISFSLSLIMRIYTLADLKFLGSIFSRNNSVSLNE